MTIRCETLEPRWDGPIIVAATGESLTPEIAEICRASGLPIIAIKQAVIRFPDADVLYACNASHWDEYQAYPEFAAFAGERWSCHHPWIDSKEQVSPRHRLRLVRGHRSDMFSTDPSVINYGNCAAFQAIGFAIHWLRKPGRIVAVGLDMRGGYFYGPHPRWGHNPPPLGSYAPYFERAAASLPEGVEIVLGTPSALTCFPQMSLEDALAGDCRRVRAA